MSSVFNKCLFCVKSKKRCDYYGMPGEFRCERCVKKEECRFLCEVCCESIKDRNLSDSCPNCKVATKEPPEKCDFIMDVAYQKLYLSIERSKCNHKIEITPNEVKRCTTYLVAFSNASSLSEASMAPTPTLPVSCTSLSPQLYAQNAFQFPVNLLNVQSQTYDPRLNTNISLNSILPRYNPSQYYNSNILQSNGFLHNGYDQDTWFTG
ncbi:29900_t:CDS:2 [Racocetra persica]|uniref:29900_t:CDS:1 n=1 Tax=Racocetra persica TaxID=160502 RepID=A0ACA9M5M4_9GLOM|nr:29900_t:CDS:2 [Racocetra persica]